MASTKSFFSLLAGLAAGAAIGILCAPDKGWKTRARVKKAAANGYEDLKENLGNLGTKVDEGIRQRGARRAGVRGMTPFTQPAEDLSRKAREYVDLRLDDVKLRTVKGLSITASKLVAFFLIIGVGTSLVLALSFGLIMLIGEIIGSYAWAAIGVAVLLGIVLGILILRRDHLFKDTFVPLFINLFFNDDDDDEKQE